MQKIIIQLLFLVCVCGCSQKSTLKDGIYEGRTQSKYKQEPFVGICKVTIESNTIKTIDFSIVDTSKNELFDAKYEQHYIGINEEYVQQCRNDWAGVLHYPKELIQKQNIDSIDAVTGATWSYNMFCDASKIALTKAKM